MFLTKKIPSCEQWLKRQYDSIYDKHLFVENVLKKARRKAEDKEAEHQRKEDEKKLKALKLDVGGANGGAGEGREEEDEFAMTGIKVLKQALMKEELGQHYDPERIADHLTSNAKVKSQQV
jgi:hypothetical protein